MAERYKNGIVYLNNCSRELYFISTFVVVCFLMKECTDSVFVFSSGNVMGTILSLFYNFCMTMISNQVKKKEARANLNIKSGFQFRKKTVLVKEQQYLIFNLKFEFRGIFCHNNI